MKLYSEKYKTQIFVKWTHFVREMKTQMYDVHILEIYSSAINKLISLYVSTDLNRLPGPHNLKVCLGYSEVRKGACLYKSSKFMWFCSNMPAEWLFSRCALQIICRMLRIVEVCACLYKIIYISI